MIDLALIPARGGSKGVPGKNIADLGGDPMIVWTIRAALASKQFERVIVSTDSDQIAEISRDAGAEVPFMRPPELATSTARSVDVVAHVLDMVGRIDRFALLQPTSPFRSALHLQEAVAEFTRFAGKKGTPGAAAMISVMATKPVEWHFKLNESGFLSSELADGAGVYRRQDAADRVAPNGAIYLTSGDSFRKLNTLMPPETRGYHMSSIDSLDVDSPDDLLLARAIADQNIRQIDTI